MEEAKEKENDSVGEQRNKKRKIVQDLNKKPKEERQNKYYWPKIDTEKKATPKPKTPKQATPKPRRKNVKREDIACSKTPELKTPELKTPELKTAELKTPELKTPELKTPELKTPDQVSEEMMENSTCKRALNFTDGDITSLNFNLDYQEVKDVEKQGLDLEKGAKPISVAAPKPKRKYVKKKATVTSTSNVLEQVVPETVVNPKLDSLVKPIVDQKIIGLGNSDFNSFYCNPKMRDEKNSITHKCMRVYRRKHGSKCLNTCRELGLNFQDSSKRKRVLRHKRSIKALKKFEGFNEFMILEDLLERIAIVRGKARKLLPMKTEIVQEAFKCVFTLMSPSMKLRRKRRSTKRFSRGNLVKKTVIHDESSCLTDIVSEGISNSACSSSDANLTEGNNKGTELQTDTKECNTEIRTHQTNTEDASLCISYVKDNGSSMETDKCQISDKVAELKTDSKDCNTETRTHQTNAEDASLCILLVKGQEATKQKTKRAYKFKGKRSDYLRGIPNWSDECLEQFMDPFIQQFESMELYDNPKTLERWSVLNGEEESKGDGVEQTYEEKVKFEEERRALLHRIARFIYVMTRSQGCRDFVKWNGSVLDSVVGVFLTQNVSDVLSSNAYIELGSRYPTKSFSNQNGVCCEDSEMNSIQGSSCSTATNVVIEHPEEEETSREEESRSKEFDAALNEMLASFSDLKTSKGKQAEEREEIDWEAIRVKYAGEGQRQRSPDARDSVDWEAVRNAPVEDIAKAIYGRGQHFIIAAKIRKTLNRIVEDHGSLDLEWLREAPPQVAKAYLLSFYGLGLKSVECLRLLTLHHHGFPVDVNIGRIVIRLGWVPIKPLPMGLHFHLLEKYPLENEIQKYLWPRLCHLDQKTLYKLHYHMITFGKVFCVKKNPNCGACPFKGECKYYASVVASKLALPRAQESRMTKSKRAIKRVIKNPFDIKRRSCHNLSLPAPNFNSSLEISRSYHMPSAKCEPIVEMPPSPEREMAEPKMTDIEDLFTDVSNNAADEEIFEVKLNTEEFKQTLWSYFEENNIPFRSDDLSSALVSLSPEDASTPLPKHMILARLRTEHQVYELPDFHPLLRDLDRRDEKDPLPYLLAIWTPDQLGNTGDSSAREKSCYSSENPQEDSSLTVPGTLLIPSRTAMKGFFALNGTYFQVNEVFADDETSQHPIQVPRVWLWNLRRRTLYCGSSTTSILRGLTWSEIQRCCCEGFICTRGFNRQTCAPKPLSIKLHNRQKGKLQQYGEDDD